MKTWKEILDNSKPVIIADLANNHSGNIDLAEQMILDLSRIQKKYNFKIVVKFQYRDLDTYIDPKFKGSKDYKFISRFESTRLEWEEFMALTRFAKENGLLTAATPFDEYSVSKVKEHQHNILKVASASANDWNLLELCVAQNMPMVVSVGGLNNHEIERVVTFLRHRFADFVLMHCVAIYPTEDHNLNLHRINAIKTKFNIATGYSTHENPSNYLAGSLAVAAGAQILERHFAKEKPGIKINGYSSTSKEFENWLEGITSTLNQLYDPFFDESLNKQKTILHELQRGLYASKDIEVNEVINFSNTYSAIPALDKQFTSNNFSLRTDLVSCKKIFKGSAIFEQDVNSINTYRPIEKILEKTRDLIILAGTSLSPDIDIEISHHYGIDKFLDYGAVLIPLINREYAKKLVVMFENQTHPEHFHKLKEESFVVLTGKLEVNLDGQTRILLPGDILLIPRLARHSMLAIKDTVFEEISSTNMTNDSYYSNSINLDSARKTLTSLWV